MNYDALLFDIAYDALIFDNAYYEFVLHFNEPSFNLKAYKPFYWSLDKFKAWTTDDAKIALYLP